MPERLEDKDIRELSVLTPEEEEAFAAFMRDVDWTDPQQRRAIALKILKYIKEDVMRDDLVGLLVNVERIPLGATPQWIVREGVKAYVHEPGSYAPRSTVTQRVFTLTTELVSVHPEMNLDQLKTGRYGTIADIRRMGTEQLLGRKYAYVWNTLIGSIASTDTNYGTFASTASTATKKAALDTALSWVNDKNIRGAKAIVGRYTAVDWISDIDGFSEKTKFIIESEGLLGSYRGVPIIRLHQYQDGYGIDRINEDEIFVIGNDTGRMGVTQDLEVMDDININDKTWHLRVDEQYGVALFYPEKNYRLAIS